MYGNPYITSSYNPQLAKERIDNQIAQLQQMKEQLPNQIVPQQASINQTFQLAPNSANTMKFVDTIDDVNKEVVYNDTPFFSKDMSVLWVKNTKNEVKTYELNELVAKDEKDLKIEFLMAQIEELKKGSVNNEQSNITKNVPNDDEPTKNEKSNNGKSSSKNDK